MAARVVIAIVFDFEDTLVPDSTSQLLEGLGMDVDAFWRETVATLVRDGWDPALAYPHCCLSLREDGVPSGSLARQRPRRRALLRALTSSSRGGTPEVPHVRHASPNGSCPSKPDSGSRTALGANAAVLPPDPLRQVGQHDCADQGRYADHRPPRRAHRECTQAIQKGAKRHHQQERACVEAVPSAAAHRVSEAANTEHTQ